MKRKAAHYWLLKTEPKEWSWDDQSKNGGISQWDGVKNRQAINNLKAMTVSDLCFFYHSGSGPTNRRVVGVVEVVKPWYECEDGSGCAVDVKSVGELKKPVGLKEIKEMNGVNPRIVKEFALVRQPRLSVAPVDREIWEKIFEMGGGCL
ncbi:Ubiquinol-Cytochrome c reductase, iron-sulfur subunit [Zostera marina]|uniref:Ubiquinol-Cytochrome c reductase, iron-sulfur subunit n=1 Tax=Zostera marina TaxID=29655 RepID=A0A0K9PNG2_ZOSMR|nr:Ubiquinol-Cytochrome c reductase, iron-sulfur subunit [Zostera marina]